MSDSSEQRPDDTRTRILEAAYALLTETSPERVSFREIARSVGLTQAGLQHHFATKERLLTEVLRYRAQVDAARFGATADLETLARVVEHNAEVPGLVRLHVLLSAQSETEGHPGREFAHERFTRVRAQLEQSIAERQQHVPVDERRNSAMLATIVQAAADGLQLQWMRDASIDMAAHLRYLYEVALPTPPSGGGEGDPSPSPH